MLKFNIGNASLDEKANPVQPLIALNEGGSVSSTEPSITYKNAYEKLEAVYRPATMVIDDVSQIPIKVHPETLPQRAKVYKGSFKRDGIERLLNYEPNPYQDIFEFKSSILVDLLTDGNAFIYFDGQYLFHLPAQFVTIVPDPVTRISHYKYSASKDKFQPHEVIHIKEPSLKSNYRGIPRLKSCTRAIRTLLTMRAFQDNFFDNSAVTGLVLKSENVISDRVKERTIENWMQVYSPKSGGRRPLILDGGMELDKLSSISFKELDFESSIANLEEKIAITIGVPPILLKGGNNANIRPNHRLYYLETILPLTRKLVRAYERFFGFKLSEDLVNIPALQPELKEQASFLTSLTNGGIITPDEARSNLGKEKLTEEQGDGNTVRVPANVAGSAVDPGEGGRPASDEE